MEIPDMTHPLSKAWDQPNKNDIVLDTTHAAMTEKTLRQLKNYSASIPSGVYEGKMWRAETKDGTHFLRWYGVGEEPDTCSINTRTILLIN